MRTAPLCNLIEACLAVRGRGCAPLSAVRASGRRAGSSRSERMGLPRCTRLFAGPSDKSPVPHLGLETDMLALCVEECLSHPCGFRYALVRISRV